MVRSGRFKLIAAPRPELYDLASDPTEQVNLYDKQRAVRDRLAKRLREMEQRFIGADPGPRGEPDEEQLRRLETLGYVSRGRTAPADADNGEGRSDPKDQIGLYNAMTSGQFDREQKVGLICDTISP